MSQNVTALNGFSVGDRVRNSGLVTQRARDYWNSCGREPMKSGAKQALDECIAARGTVISILPGDYSRGVSPGIEVAWDDGTVSKCLTYRIDHA